MNQYKKSRIMQHFCSQGVNRRYGVIDIDVTMDIKYFNLLVSQNANHYFLALFLFQFHSFVFE